MPGCGSRRCPDSLTPSYVISTYREIVALTHDPGVSSDLKKRTRGVEALQRYLAGLLDYYAQQPARACCRHCRDHHRKARRSSRYTPWETATRIGTPTPTKWTSNARTTSTSATAAGFTCVSGVRWRGWRPRSRWVSLFVAWTTRGSLSTRRRTATTRSSVDRDNYWSTSTGSETKQAAPPPFRLQRGVIDSSQSEQGRVLSRGHAGQAGDIHALVVAIALQGAQRRAAARIP